MRLPKMADCSNCLVYGPVTWANPSVALCPACLKALTKLRPAKGAKK